MADGRLDPGAFAALKRFARPRRSEERCELCAAALPPQHAHLLEAGTRKLVCACEPCSILFTDRTDGRFLRVPRDMSRLDGFAMPAELWDAMAIPIGLAFFARRGAGVIAAYPSPAGAVEEAVPAETWAEVVAANPTLADLRPEVEAVIANRVTTPHEYYRVPIDECFKLVGLVRTHWRGLAGGEEVWAAVRGFFEELAARCA